MTEFLKKLFGVRKFLYKEYENMPEHSKVLDIGCFGFVQFQNTNVKKNLKFQHYGIDYITPEIVPDEFTFAKCDVDNDKFPFPDDYFDIVVASHVIEHLKNPLNLISESLRVCKPNGKVYIEAPSERSMFLPGMSFNFDNMHCISFFDDPTHLGRPWSPQAFHRVAKYYNAIPIRVGYYKSWIARFIILFLLPFLILFRFSKAYEFLIWHSVGWASFAIFKKKDSKLGKEELNYFIPDN